MIKHKIEVVKNATNVANINPEKPYEQVVADCMKDYLEYRKLEEQGLILKLPCKVGDTVYRIVGQRDNFTDQTYKIVLSVGFKLDMVDKIGKSVFLTKEEAEQKLKEMERDTNGKN